MPNVLYLVIGECGEYDDWRTWNVIAYRTKKAATEHVRQARAWAKAFEQKFRAKWGDEWWLHSHEDKTPNPFDPKFNTDSTGTKYSITKLPLGD